MGQVAGRRMAGIAFSCAVEISLSGLGIAGDYVQSFVGSAICRQLHLQMEEFRDVAQLLIWLRREKLASLSLACRRAPSAR